MVKAYLAHEKKTAGDQAVDGLVAGLAAGVAMAIVLAGTGLVSGRSPLATLGDFDPAQGGNWLTGLLAHLAVAAIYGMIFALLLGLLERIRPSFSERARLWGPLYGLVLLGVAYGVWFMAVDSPLAQIAVWQMATAHFAYGLVLGFWLDKN